MRVGVDASFRRAHEAERRIEYEERLLRTVGVLERVAERDRAGITTKPTAHANDNKENRKAEENRLTQVVEPRGIGDWSLVVGRWSLAICVFGSAEEVDQCGHHDEGKKGDVPILLDTLKEDGEQVAIVLELAEEGDRGSAVSEPHIDHVNAVDSDADQVRDNKEILRYVLIGLVKTPFRR